jgi:hypothetical protein
VGQSSKQIIELWTRGREPKESGSPPSAFNTFRYHPGINYPMARRRLENNLICGFWD